MADAVRQISFICNPGFRWLVAEIRALSGDGEELSIPESQESLDNPAVITDQSFYEDDPEEPGKGPVRA